MGHHIVPSIMRASFNAMPQRGMTMVASRFNGWYKVEKEYACL